MSRLKFLHRLLFDGSECIGRLNYFTIFLVNIFLLFLVTGLANFFSSSIVIFVITINLLIHIQTTIKRLHDLNYKEFWILLLLIPSVNIIFQIILFVAPGVNKDNNYK